MHIYLNRVVLALGFLGPEDAALKALGESSNSVGFVDVGQS
jgi:hypothetical protein